MLIVQLDEPILFVFESAGHAAREIEAIDIENELRAAFDDSAVPYQVNWIKPNRTGKLLGLLPWVTNGEYELIPAGPPARDALLALLQAHPGMPDPPAARSALDSLLETLRAV